MTLRNFAVTTIALAALASTALPALASGTNAGARVRVIHASPDAPAVDVLVNGQLRLFQNVKFGDATSYAAVPANFYDVKVVPAGGGAGSAVIDADLNLGFYGTTTVIALDTLDRIAPLVLDDTRFSIDQTVTPGSARLRFVHASPDAPAVDIKVANGPYLFRNVSFKGATDYVLVPAGRVDLEVRAAGTETVALNLNGLLIDAGSTYTAVALGKLSGTPALTAGLYKDASNAPSILPRGRR